MPKAVQLMLEEELAQKYESLSSEKKKKLMEMIQDLLKVESSWASLGDILNRLAQGEEKKQTGQLIGRRSSHFGSAKGKIKIADDFNEPLDGFEGYQ